MVEADWLHVAGKGIRSVIDHYRIGTFACGESAEKVILIGCYITI